MIRKEPACRDLFKKIIPFLALIPLLISQFNDLRLHDLVSDHDGVIRWQDFAIYLAKVNHFWWDGDRDLYDPDFFRRSFQSAFGLEVNRHLVFPLSPLALLLLAPFGFVALIHYKLAHILWLLFSVAVLMAGIMKFQRLLTDRFGGVPPLYTALVVVFLSSGTMFKAGFTGQTSMLGVGILLWLLCHFEAHERPVLTIGRRILSFTIFGFMFLKPPYTVLAMLSLLAFAKYRLILLVSGTILAVLFFMSFFLDPTWLTDYLGHLSRAGSDPSYLIPDRGFYLETFLSLVSVAPPWIGAQSAAKISGFVLLIGWGILAALAFFLGSARAKAPKHQESSMGIAALATGLYLCFIQYKGAYEEIFLFVPVCYLVIKNPRLKLGSMKSLRIFMAFILVMNFSSVPVPFRGWVWLAEFGLISAVAVYLTKDFLQMRSRS